MPTPDQGWSWWWRYVLMTNIGWFPGLFTGAFVDPLSLLTLPRDPIATPLSLTPMHLQVG